MRLGRQSVRVAVIGVLLLAPRALAQPSPQLRQYVAVGSTQLVIRGGSVVRRGSVAATSPGGFMLLGKAVQLPSSSDAAADRVRLLGGASVGRLFANTLTDGGAIIIDGGPFPVALPLALAASLPPFPFATPGGTAVEVPEDATLVLPPGSYDIVRVRSRGRLVLQGLTPGSGAGTYDMRTLTLAFDSSLLADNPVVVNIADRLAVSGQSFLGPSARAAALAGDVQVNVGGAAARLGQGSTVTAHIGVVGKITIGPGSAFTGRLIASRIATSHDVSLARQGGCGDGVLDSGEQCDTSADRGDAACPGRCIPGDPQGQGRIALGQAGQCTCRCTSNADCDDHDACNGVETCQAGVCVFGPAPQCDDGNPCTSDCDPARGCIHTSVLDGTSCSDGNACTRDDTCQGGVCTPGPARNCDDRNTCTTDGCDPLRGCTHRALPDGTACTDGNACTAPDTCLRGTCNAGPTVNCGDGNTCTDDTCDPQVGCPHRPLPDGTSCSDGNVCTNPDTCRQGACVPGPMLSCDDRNPCTGDSCDPLGGCMHTVVRDGTGCSDGDQCTTADVCQRGVCVGGPANTCDDGNSCTGDTCDPVAGCRHTAFSDGTACLDGDACTQLDTCQRGVCVGGPAPSCADTNPCTADLCDSVSGCRHPVVADGTSCGPGKTCQTGVCR